MDSHSGSDPSALPNLEFFLNPASKKKGCVLRWKPKKKASFDAHSKMGPKSGEIRNSNLNPPDQAPKHSGPAPPPPLILCSHYLGLGHNRKDCSQMVRCRACFNYEHVSSRCLSKNHDKWHFRRVSRCGGEGSSAKGINAGSAPPIEPSVSSVPPSPTTAHPENPTSTMATGLLIHAHSSLRASR